jgi:hypothetical protein
MSGTSVGARGDTGVDMRASGFEAKEALCITSIAGAGEGVQYDHTMSRPGESHFVVPALSRDP